MNNTFAFDESIIKRMPLFLILIILLLLGLPYIGLNLGLDFSIQPPMYNQTMENYLLEASVRGYFRQILLQWSGFALAAVTALLAFTRYKLSQDRIALVIGFSILFTGTIEACHTLFMNGFTANIDEKNNFDALIWTFSNTLGGLILIAGLTFLVNIKKEEKLTRVSILIFCFCLILMGAMAIYYVTSPLKIPAMWVPGEYTARPYEIIPILIYLTLILFVYPKTYKKQPSILSHCILYIGITQIIMGMYLMLFSHSAYDSAYNIAYFLKIVAYFIPCSCLIIHYVYSYSAVLKAQKVLSFQQEELKYIATHDSLTNLFNRREFEDLLEKSVSNALRNNTSLALLLIDLDNFKATNDTYGHIHGDELLKQFSNRLVLLIRKGDILARVGGDEFTLISPNIKSPSSARQLAQRILNELNSPYLINGRLITVTVSIGISIFPTDGRNAEKLLIKADLAMYKAKNSGKNTYQFYTEELSYLQHRESEIEAHLRKALQQDEFELNFQPKYNLVNNKIIGAEVLLRWGNEILGSPSPNEFIPVAEHSGLIMDIGNWVLKKTCEQIVAWKQQYPDNDLSFSINISPIQLANGQFLTIIKKILAELEYSANNLEFEITENVLMGEGSEIATVLNSISELGIKISLDDFGKGYSSLNRLKTLPIDTLKIDKYFISDIHNKTDKVVIVDIIIKLAYELGMNIIAEGIETQSQLEYLVAKKCNFGQGFLLSQPVSIEAFEKLAFNREV
jgi:diguanylate cyclase (GGDEF)-like protein